jgi:hypothetical protein
MSSLHPLFLYGKRERNSLTFYVNICDIFHMT